MALSTGPTALRCPCVLALDTSTEWMACAIQGPRGARTLNVAGGAAASSRLIPALHALLDDVGLGWSDIDAIAFGQGPGAFTGLRTACAVAQGLGLGLGRPLIAIDSLLIVAEDARMQGSPQPAHDHPSEIGVVMDARMDEAYAARYRWQHQRWQTLQPPALFTLPALLDDWLASSSPLHALAGSGLGVFSDRLQPLLATHRIAQESDRAAALLRLAVRAAAEGAGIDAALALPLYLRDRVALTTHEREAARASRVDEREAARASSADEREAAAAKGPA